MAQAGPQKKKSNSSSQNIKVVVRVRPLSNEERDKRVKTVVQCVSLREIQAKEKNYYFDRAFEPDSSQMDIYSFVVAPMISDVLAGYNCTVFAYGQTGTGKTHTMTGGDPSLSSMHWKEDELAGCIPRAAANIFDEIGSMKVTDYNVRVSFLELYNEEVRDLLISDERPLPLNIFNDNKGSVCIQNLKEVTVFTSNEIYMLLQQGTHKRQTAATLMNNHSSRSHTVFTITVHTREASLRDEEVLKTGKINLVDLAGSENIAKSGAKDKRAQELANINKSLLTLGRVIQILAEKNNKHVPYRDSKLTRILQDSLGGHTKTCIIATVSPSHTSFEETQSTLEYASRARNIRNTPMINEKVTKAQMIKEMTHEIEKLKKDLYAARNGDGFFIDRENWDELTSQLQSSSNTLTLKNDIIEDMKKKLSDLEMIRDIKRREFEEVMNVCQHKEKVIDKAKALLKEQQLSLKQEQYLSRYYLEAATENKVKAKELLEATKHLSMNQDILQKKLENQYFNNYSNETIIKEKSALLGNNLTFSMNKLENMNNLATAAIIDCTTKIDYTKSMWNKYAVRTKASWEDESKPLLDSAFAQHSQLIKANTQNTMDGLVEYRQEVNEMVGLVNDNISSCTSAYEEFVKYDESKSVRINALEGLLNNLHSHLLREKKDNEVVLRDLDRFADITRKKIGKLDMMLNSIEISHPLYKNSANSNEDDDRKLKIKTNFDDVGRNNQLLSSALQNTTDSLGSQMQSSSENQERLINSNQRIKENVNQVMSDRLNMDTALVTSDTELDSLKGDLKSVNELVESNIFEINAILHSTEEIRNDILTKIIPVKRAGDTPKQNHLNYPKRISEGGLSRNVLIKKFKDEFNEDIENESFHLNVSSDSIQPLDDSDE